MKVDKYKLSLEALEYFSQQSKPVLRSNVIGLAYQEGNFGRFHDRELTNEERSLLDLVLRELQEKRLIQPVYRELISRGEDLQITNQGRRSLKKRILDDLDELLLAIQPKRSDLIGMRYGAYDAALSKQTDWQRQAASSLVELIDHTLRAIAPKDKVAAKYGFPKKGSKVGSVRQQKVRYFLEERQGARSKSTEEVVKKAWELIESCRKKLEGIKHTTDNQDEVEQLIKLTEDALIFLLKR